MRPFLNARDQLYGLWCAVRRYRALRGSAVPLARGRRRPCVPHRARCMVRSTMGLARLRTY
eukprot:768675-Prymnesium_polylepis.1